MNASQMQHQMEEIVVYMQKGFRATDLGNIDHHIQLQIILRLTSKGNMRSTHAELVLARRQLDELVL